jgi:sterol desaturase/sphingolipid hydroxylase (fatty acid hydroxylase superfamily)
MATLLVVLWTWEGWWPFLSQFPDRRSRLTHDTRNLLIGLGNTVLLALLFGAAIVGVIGWADRSEFGLLRWGGLSGAAGWIGAILLLDGWLYLWHRANHRLAWLWRFHRMHHSDPRMDATTATRFHLGEHVLSSILRLGLLPLFGVSLLHVAVYDTLVVANTLIHHANISFGRADRWLRLLLVTPDMHKVHHSRCRPETDSNYSTVLSIWDRIGRSLRGREDYRGIEFGLDEFDAADWQTLRGMLRTPFVRCLDKPSVDVAGSTGQPES